MLQDQQVLCVASGRSGMVLRFFYGRDQFLDNLVEKRATEEVPYTLLKTRG